MKNFEMTDDEKLRVLNAIMWIQTCVYACDNVEDVKWFMAKRVKYLAKGLVEAATKDHIHIIKALWDDEGTQMGLVTSTMDGFCERIAKINYWKIPEINHLLDLYSAGHFDHLFIKPADDDQKGKTQG